MTLMRTSVSLARKPRCVCPPPRLASPRCQWFVVAADCRLLLSSWSSAAAVLSLVLPAALMIAARLYFRLGSFGHAQGLIITTHVLIAHSLCTVTNTHGTHDTQGAYLPVCVPRALTPLSAARTEHTTRRRWRLYMLIATVMHFVADTKNFWALGSAVSKE